MPKSTATAKDIRVAKVISVILAIALCVGYGGLHAARMAEASRIRVAKKRAALVVETHRFEEITAAKRLQLGGVEALRRESPWTVTAGKHDSPSGRNRGAVTASSAYVIRLELTAYRARLANTFGSLYQSLGLTPAEIDAFEASLTSYVETLLDLRAVAASDGLDEAGPEIAALTKQANEELRGEQIALLGGAGYQQLQQFERVLPLQNFVLGLARFSGFPPEPLTEDQVQKLTAVLANASEGYQSGAPANPASVDWDAALAQAQGILTEAQFQRLKTAVSLTQVDGFRARFFEGNQGLQ